MDYSSEGMRRVRPLNRGPVLGCPGMAMGIRCWESLPSDLAAQGVVRLLRYSLVVRPLLREIC